MTVPIQNFSVPRGNDQTIFVLVTADVQGETLIDSTVVWRVYPMLQGVAQTQNAPVIMKVTEHGITNLESPPMSFLIALQRSDTINLAFGNYFHEAEITDEINDHVTVLNGVMTITFTGDLPP